jgi:hypothetical protein
MYERLGEAEEGTDGRNIEWHKNGAGMAGGNYEGSFGTLIGTHRR